LLLLLLLSLLLLLLSLLLLLWLLLSLLLSLSWLLLSSLLLLLLSFSFSSFSSPALGAWRVARAGQPACCCSLPVRMAPSGPKASGALLGGMLATLAAPGALSSASWGPSFLAAPAASVAPRSAPTSSPSEAPARARLPGSGASPPLLALCAGLATVSFSATAAVAATLMARGSRVSRRFRDESAADGPEGDLADVQRLKALSPEQWDELLADGEATVSATWLEVTAKIPELRELPRELGAPTPWRFASAHGAAGAPIPVPLFRGSSSGGSGSPFTTARRLNSELANGRLALLAAFASRRQGGIVASAVARRAVDEAVDEVEISEAGKAVEAMLVAEKELPEDGYGWDEKYVEKVAPFAPSKQVGATAPMGFFDPLGFTKEGDKEGYRKLAASEIKHGRIAMMASVGLLVQHYIKIPGFEKARASFSSQFDVVFSLPALYIFSVFTWLLFFFELSFWSQAEDREPGDFGDPFNFQGFLGKYDTEWRNKEINNGRFAMICTSGIVVAQALTGKDGVQQLGF